MTRTLCHRMEKDKSRNGRRCEHKVSLSKQAKWSRVNRESPEREASSMYYSFALPAVAWVVFQISQNVALFLLCFQKNVRHVLCRQSISSQQPMSFQGERSRCQLSSCPSTEREHNDCPGVHLSKKKCPGGHIIMYEYPSNIEELLASS